jgi:cell wall-associated NlpC family hydrolase
MNLGCWIAAEAKNWLGVPYQHRGMTKRGCDCTGLLIGILQLLGYLPNYKLREYPKDWNLHAGAGDYIREEISKIADLVLKTTTIVPNPQHTRQKTGGITENPGNDTSKINLGHPMQPGDILLFRFGKCIAHCGILIDKKTFIHCYIGAGKACYSILAPQNQWSNRLVEIYRINENKLMRCSNGR